LTRRGRESGGIPCDDSGPVGLQDGINSEAGLHGTPEIIAMTGTILIMGWELKGSMPAMRCGLAILEAGRVRVPDARVTEDTLIFLTAQTAGVPMGILGSTQDAGTSFTIVSNEETDASTVAWLLIEPGPSAPSVTT
jgi:hypothetical protein